jgi:hypothetical protein
MGSVVGKERGLRYFIIWKVYAAPNSKTALAAEYVVTLQVWFVGEIVERALTPWISRDLCSVEGEDC